MGAQNGFVAPLERLAEQFRKLPGIGKKSAYRMAYHVLDYTKEEAAKAIEQAGFDVRIRGEKLGLSEFAKLADELEKMREYR